jgi:hypothetical protein
MFRQASGSTASLIDGLRSQASGFGCFVDGLSLRQESIEKGLRHERNELASVSKSQMLNSRHFTQMSPVHAKRDAAFVMDLVVRKRESSAVDLPSPDVSISATSSVEHGSVSAGQPACPNQVAVARLCAVEEPIHELVPTHLMLELEEGSATRALEPTRDGCDRDSNTTADFGIGESFLVAKSSQLVERNRHAGQHSTPRDSLSRMFNA